MVKGFENLRQIMGDSDCFDPYENVKLLRGVLKEYKDAPEGFGSVLETYVDREESSCIESDVCPGCGGKLAFVKTGTTYTPVPYGSSGAYLEDYDGYKECVECGAEFYD